jgi:hypothetical protein
MTVILVVIGAVLIVAAIESVTYDLLHWTTANQDLSYWFRPEQERLP